MYQESYPSKLLEKAVFEFSKLPGIGQKTALRLVLHLLRQEKQDVELFGNTLITLKKEVKECKVCKNISDTEVCNICASNMRDNSIICVVENIRDVMSIENTHQFNGLYHVLGGIISPMDGIGPGDLHIDSLINRAAQDEVEEVLFALPTTMEGDTTNFYIYRKLGHLNKRLTMLARGVAMGGDLEFTDDLTLSSSIVNRRPFEPGK
ncbi:MAG: recombination protein RecR [Bacteroidales bacterium]|nr:recombination protein RecR [Bacteroidales bacterium]